LTDSRYVAAMSCAPGVEHVIQSQETSPEGPASFCLMDPRGTIGADGCAADPVRSSPASESLVMGEQRVGRCLCAKDSGVRKPIVKKRVEIQSSGSASGAVRGHSEPATAHIVPKVQVFTSSANCGTITAPPAATAIGAVKASDTLDSAQVIPADGPPMANHSAPQLVLVPAIKKVSRATNTFDSGDSGVVCAPCKPILTNSIQRNHWNSSSVAPSTSMEAVGIDQDVQPARATCLRRYGSSQSCKSATTLRSVTSTSRGQLRHFLPL
jgi:hypothetical protein